MTWFVLSLLLAAGSEARLPPGQDDLFAQMLGRGATLPDGCTWNGALIDRSFVISQYDCGGSNVKLTLKHTSDVNAPNAIAHTKRFVFFGELPTALREDLVARVRASEVNVIWDFSTLPMREQARATTPFPTGLALVLALAVFAAAFAAFSTRWAAKRWRLAERANPLVRGVALVPLSVAGGALIRDAFRHTVDFVTGDHLRASYASIIVGAVLGSALLALASSLLRRGALLVAATLTVALTTFWFVTIAQTPMPMFGTVSTLVAEAAVYPLNSRGFRGPEFALEKKPGVTRIALIGDSFVAGDGIVQEDQTLAMQLGRELAQRNPNANYEVLNLGIGGNNLASHVSTAGEALRQLDLDAVVVCLTLNNDLSPVDGQVLRSAARRPSVFSFLRALIGDQVNDLVIRLTSVGHELTAREIEHGAAQSARISALHGQFPKVKLLVFTFHQPDRELLSRFEQPMITPPTFEVGDFIAGDGHPTDHGAGRFAQLIAEVLLREAAQ